MTIAVSLKVNDGVVLAADSATTLIGQSPDGSVGVVNVYNNANKIFNLVKDWPIGVVTWGAGSIGTASVSTLVKDLRARLSGKLSEDNSWVLNFQPSLLPVRLTTPGHHLQLTLGRLTPPRKASRPFDTTDDPAERDYQQGRTGRGSERGASQAWFWTPEWQAREREAEEDLAAGRFTRHESDEEFLAALRARRLRHADPR
jgi:hypothetical protein